MLKVYLIGALKNRAIMDLANRLRAEGLEVFDEWITPGPEADSFLHEWAKKQGLNYKQTLNSYAARHVFEFDKHHIDRCDVGVLVMPAGKSAHTEMGYMIGCGKKVYMLFDAEPDRVDVMQLFATDIFFNVEDLVAALK